MDVRPLDYGDEHPSDIGDVAPISPVAGFSEYNGFTGSIWSRRKPKSRITPEFVPDPKIPEKFLPRRLSFDGIILKRITPKNGVNPTIYRVMRQDGRVIQAEATGREGYYNDYRNGDSVTIQETQRPDIYSIVGEPQGLQLVFIEVSALGPFAVNIALTIPFDTVQEQTGIGFDLVNPAVIIEGEADTALYEINYKLTIENDVELPIAGQLHNYLGCYDPDYAEIEAKTVRGQIFDKQSGFKMSETDCLNLFWLSGGSTHYMPYQPGGGGPILWSGDPKLAGSFKLGTQIPQGWIKIHTSGDSFVWLGNGNSRHMYRMPNNGPVIDSYLRVAGISVIPDIGTAIQLEHTVSGASGQVNYTDCLGYCRSFTVNKGLITGGYGLETISQNPPCAFSDIEAGDYEPC